MEQYNLVSDGYEDGFECALFAKYTGPAVDKHSMSAELYATSLLGLSKSFVKVNKELLHLDITMEIVAEEQGSLKATLKVVKNGAVAYATIASILSFHGVQAKDVGTALFSAYDYVITEIKEAKGSKDVLLDKIDRKDIPEEQKKKLKKLVSSNDLRLALDDMTLFLESNGLENIEIYSYETTRVSINKSERPYFRAQPEDLRNVQKYNDYVQIVGISTDENWKFDGIESKGKFTARILDKDFLDQLKIRSAKEIFQMTFEAEIIKTTVTKAGNKKPSPPTYEITALRHDPRPEELPLPIAYDKALGG
ncbi:hypothetical protein [Halodesulfovibrio aestuarii]|uniref:Uncharacterized protein n=1 Tax=Halodesulfovibrio aestuarii TaxID=126333 RepID=A0ABV4JVF2_9BACT